MSHSVLTFFKEYFHHVIRPLQPLCEEGGEGISILTVYREILRHSASFKKSPEVRHESLTELGPELGVASTSPFWWSPSLTVTVPGAQYTPLGHVYTERSVRYLPWPLSQLFSFYLPSP